MSQVNKTYDTDFKKRAVQMVATSQKPSSHIAKELGISSSTLHGWVKQFGAPTDTSGEAQSHADLLAEIKKLKKDLAYVTEQREILKKAAVILGR